MRESEFEFIGKDGSLGYRKGQIYDIRHYIQGGLIWVNGGSSIVNYCPYESIDSFLDNWKRVDKRG